MKIKIIDRKEEDKRTLAEYLGISNKELKEVKEEIKKGEEKRRRKMEEYNNNHPGKELIIEYCPPVIEGKLAFLGDMQGTLRKTFKYEQEQERKHMKIKLKEYKVPYKSLIKRI